MLYCHVNFVYTHLWIDSVEMVEKVYTKQNYVETNKRDQAFTQNIELLLYNI